MAARFGYGSAYKKQIVEKEEKAMKEIPELEAAIMEGIVQFAFDMKVYTGSHLPAKSVVFAAVILPQSFKNLKHKVRLVDHMYIMQRFGDCVFQGCCFFFGLPTCRWCERCAPWYPPGYYVPYEITPDNPPAWGLDVADDEVL